MKQSKRSFSIALILVFLTGVAFAQEPTKQGKKQPLAPSAASNPVVGSGTVGHIARWLGSDGNTFTIGNSNIYEDKFGKVGIGTKTPTSLLTVQGMIETTLGGVKFPDGTVQTTSAASALFGVAHNATLTGNGTAAMPLGVAVPLILSGALAFPGALVKATNTAASGVALFGESPNGTGVHGFADNGFGVIGESTSGIGVNGISASGDGVSGESTSGRGVSGSSDSGNGVAGSSTSGRGVYGASTNGRGVEGSSTSNDGVFGSSTNSRGVVGSSTSDLGVAGFSTNSDGVFGLTDSTSSNKAGITSESSLTATGGVAGIFKGNVRVESLSGQPGNLSVAGTLSKGAGAFKIDHPLDPENKYLYHSFVESPDMKNIYDGVAVLDDRGEAVVELPQWFEALNNKFRYQLTCIGGFAPIYIAEKIADNRFRIAGGQPGMEISWMVTGIRRDAFAKKNRIPVEEEKPEAERGYYLHPEAFDQPQEKSIQWARDPEGMQQLKKRQIEAGQTRNKRQPDQR